MNDYQRIYPLSHHILVKMKQYQYNKKTLAKKMNLCLEIINKLLDDKIPLSETMAEKLGLIFNTSKDYWFTISLNSKME